MSAPEAQSYITAAPEVGKQLVGTDGQLLLFLQLLRSLLHRETREERIRQRWICESRSIYTQEYRFTVVFGHALPLLGQLLQTLLCHGSEFSIRPLNAAAAPVVLFSIAVLAFCMRTMKTLICACTLGKRPHDLESARSHSCLI